MIKQLLWAAALLATLLTAMAAIIAAIWLVAKGLGVDPINIVLVLCFLVGFGAPCWIMAEDFKCGVEWLLQKLKNWRGKAS